jgi:uncharacterized protein (DUF2384 family)
MDRITIAGLVEELERDLGLGHAEMAQALGVHARTVERWMRGDIPQRNEGRERLDELQQLRNRVYSTFNSRKAARAWLDRDNRYLGNIPPVTFLRTGRIDRVNAALKAINSGYFV